MKDRKDIQQILDRYWAGETSLEEETTVRSALSDDPSTDPAAAALASYFRQEGKQASNRDFVLPNQTKVRSIWHRYRAVAAVAIMLLGTFFFLQRSAGTSDLDTFQDPDQAYAEVVEALQFISGKMNSGMNTAGASLDKVKPLDDIFN